MELLTFIERLRFHSLLTDIATMFFQIIGRKLSELLLEALGEIGGSVETDGVEYPRANEVRISVDPAAKEKFTVPQDPLLRGCPPEKAS